MLTGEIPSGSAGMSLFIICITAAMLAKFAYGGDPVRSSTTVQPRLHTSDAGLSLLLLMTSGATGLPKKGWHG